MAKKEDKNVVYVTKEGLKKLEDELKHLKDERRVEIADKLKEAISFGDLSENAEYEEARNEQAQVELRISELEEQLKNVKIIKEAQNAKEDNRVTIGKEVTIVNLEDQEKETYKIVGTTESNILSEIPKISNDSPVGKVLLGKNVGDVIKVKSNAGNSEYKIISIK